ncbi:P-selectin glycoprotein ligand 1 [Scomber scombrus]|uniref:P-selectin glycoprotein ligand 1 n=1 Tax=Scomber scombrus TaxID=13677 RepID=UPI002DD95204|nr:P-selectin glycoprotein ligand 1 [Scomber scombrus]
MISLNTKRYLPLLWGISILFFMESKSASIPETSSISSTAEPNKTTKQLSTAHVHHSATEMSLQPGSDTQCCRMETKEALSNISGSSTVGSVVMNTEAATINNSGLQLPGGSTDAPAVTTAASRGQRSHDTTISETAEPTDLPQSQTTSTGMNVSPAAPSTAPVTVSEISSVTVAVSSSMSTYINELDVTTKSYSTNSSDYFTQAAQNFSSPSNLSTTATTTNTSSEASDVLNPDSTSSPARISEISTVSTELSSVSQPVSATRSLISASNVPDTARPSSTTESPTPSISTDPANSTAVSTSLAGVLIPRVPIPTTKSTPATTTAAHEVSKCPPITEVKPCSSRRVVNVCLITIASLALLATIFMVSTIVLCVKLSARKYKVKRPQNETEMMCISTLLPDRTNNYTRQRNPVANGVLVFPNGRYYDEDGGDDVTLSSFLPDNDRYI